MYSPEYFNQYVRQNAWTHNAFSMLHFNARSLKNKGEEIEGQLEKMLLKFVLCVTETWFASDRDVYLFNGYREFSVFRRWKKGGGVTVYIGDDVDCSMETEYSLISNNYEIVTVSFCNTYLIAIYRPPSGNATRFFEYLDHVLAYVSTSSKKL